MLPDGSDVSEYPQPSSRNKEGNLNNSSKLMILLGTKLTKITAYHPQTKGMVECFHHQIKAALKAQPNPDAWMDTLPFILLGIQTAHKEDFSMTAAEMVYGTNLCVLGELISPTTRQVLCHASSFMNQMRAYLRNMQTTKPRITPMYLVWLCNGPSRYITDHPVALPEVDYRTGQFSYP